eukprot:7881878-Lingulodinium_polyedra.AAC.1
MDCPWNVYGLPLDCPWIEGLPVYFLGMVRGPSMGSPLISWPCVVADCPLTVHVQPMESPWVAHGVYVDCPRTVLGLSVD